MRRLLRTAFCFLALLIAPATAQDLLVARDDVQGSAPNGGVYVHDSAVAMDSMALAQRLENLKEWNKSAEVYQQIVEKYRDRVVPSATDDNGVIDQYKSVLSRVNQHLAAWPPEGLAVYRNLYELPARDLLAQARGDNLAPLHEVFTRYFVTDAGKQAGLRLIDSYFELGDFSAATWIGQALLFHPNLAMDRPKVLFRVGLAAHLSGDAPTADQAMRELKGKFPAAIATIGGRDVLLADALQAELSRAPAQRSEASAALSDDSWPTVGGDAGRNKISTSTARPGAKLYSVHLAQPSWKLVTDAAQRKTLEAQDQAFRQDGAALGVMPVADRGELFFQDNAHVYALSLQTGQPLSGWRATYPDQNGQYLLANAVNLPTGQQLSLTVSDSAVLAVMNLPDPLTSLYNLASDQDAKLVCLDRASGKELWTLSPHDLPDENLRMLRFGGCPLVVGGNVYLAARGVKGNGYEDRYVVCADLASGVCRWCCYVAGAPSAGPPIQDANNQATSFEVATHLSYASGRIFVATNMGAVAALDAYSGSVAWLDIYRDASDNPNPNGAMMPMARFGGFNRGLGLEQSWAPPSPWTANAPIVCDGNVFVLPSDGKYLMVYDAGSGRVVNKLLKSNCCRTQLDDESETTSVEPIALLGVLSGANIKDQGSQKQEDLLLLATPTHVCAIKWRQYNPDRPNDAIAWANFPRDEAIRGRPFITADSVYIPTAHKLYRVAIRNGQIMETYPADGNWPSEEGPGNVMVCGEQIVIAGDRDVSVYTDLTLARAKLDSEIAAAGADPNARLHYAEVMFLANRAPDAAEKLDEAIQLLTPATGAARIRAFNDALTFALKSSKNAADASDAAALFDRAAGLAQSPGQQVEYRLARARFDRDDGHLDLFAAIGMYQEILSTDAWRTATAMVERPAAAPDTVAAKSAQDLTQAGLAAQNEIDQILKDPKGAAAYQPFEVKAHAQFKDALAAHDPDRLWAIAVGYPNSTVAAEAQAAAADEYEAAGRFLQATEVLRQIYLDAGDEKKKAAILEAMARNYLQLPGRLSTAAGRLEKAALLDPTATLKKPLALPGGAVLANVTLDQAKDTLSKLADSQAARPAANLPRFGFPSHAASRAYLASFHKPLFPFAPTEAVIPDVGTLLAADAEAARYDRLATWTGGRGLSVYASADGRLLGADPDITDEPRGAAWVNRGKDLLVWSAAKVYLAGAEPVGAKWSMDLNLLPDLEVLAEAVPKVRPANLIVPMDFRTARRLIRGGLLPSVKRPFVPAPLPRGDDPAAADSDDGGAGADSAETVVGLQPAGNLALLTTSTGRVAAVDLFNGSIRWQLRLVDHAVDRLAATDDFTVITASDPPRNPASGPTVRLLILDTQSGRLLARQIFPGELNAGPINIALSDDGTLAYTLPDQIDIRDLFEVGRDPDLEHPPITTPALPGRPFAGMTRPDQLLIDDGQILALSDDGKRLRGYAIQTGLPRQYGPRNLPMDLSTGGGSDQTGMRVAGGYVYAWSPQSIAAYNVDDPVINWGPDMLDTPGVAQQLLLGTDYLILVNQPPQAQAAVDSWWLSAFSRALIPNKPNTESGALVYIPRLTDPHGLLAAAPIEGGMCYLAGDHRLHLLRGRGDGPITSP